MTVLVSEVCPCQGSTILWQDLKTSIIFLQQIWQEKRTFRNYLLLKLSWNTIVKWWYNFWASFCQQGCRCLLCLPGDNVSPLLWQQRSLNQTQYPELLKGYDRKSSVILWKNIFHKTWCVGSGGGTNIICRLADSSGLLDDTRQLPPPAPAPPPPAPPAPPAAAPAAAAAN